MVCFRTGHNSGINNGLVIGQRDGGAAWRAQGSTRGRCMICVTSA